jgi:hypothetical protein
MWKENRMFKGTSYKIVFFLSVVTIVFLLYKNAFAVPSFARQTGLSCYTCHTVFPELTPAGRAFKLEGYVMSKSSKLFEFPPPLAASATVSFTHVAEKLPAGSIEDEWSNRRMSSGNNVLNIPQEASIFYGGRVIDHFGAFIQGTFDGTTNTFHLDMTDLRYANTTTLNGKNLVYGIMINNSPTVQDVWNSTPAWGFPFESSDIAPTPAASTIIDGTLDQQVGGIGLYAFWNDLLYAEMSLYHTTKNSIAHVLGMGTDNDTIVDNLAPYWRVFLQEKWEEHVLSVGTYGIYARIFPEGRDSGPTDKFTDIAFDVQYQYLGKKNILSAESTWIHERQRWNSSHDLGNTENSLDSLDTFKINLNYYYKAHFGHLGGSVAYFSTNGDSDNLLYAPEEVEGSRNGSPDSNGFIIEAHYLPIDRIKCTVQYTFYTKFNGSRSNYDGSGRDASDNNTIFLALSLLL